jgi:hypothetical protein
VRTIARHSTHSAAGNVLISRRSLSADVPLSSKPRVNAGFMITRGKYGLGPQGYGTAGLIVRGTGVATGFYLLTCAHVLGRRSLDAAAAAVNEDLVYSPYFKDCSGLECNKPLGKVERATVSPNAEELDPVTNAVMVMALIKLGSQPFAVDAALVRLDDATNGYNEVPEIGQIVDQRDLIAEWGLAAGVTDLNLPAARQLAVKKFGATTKLTLGRIKSLAHQHVIERPDAGAAIDEPAALVFEIQADPAQAPFTAEYELDMPRYGAIGITKPSDIAAEATGAELTATVGGSVKSPTLKVSGRTFAQPGDSGAPILDQSNKIVGLVRSVEQTKVYVKDKPDPVKLSKGNTRAIFIGAALQKLQVQFVAAGRHSAGPAAVVPGMAIGRAEPDLGGWAPLGDWRASLERNPTGARLAVLARQHFDEVRNLIHHRRRVTVTWHRHKGPAFLAAFLRVMNGESTLTPTDIDGVRLVDAARAMRDVLSAEGSRALRQALAENAPEILMLAEKSASLESALQAVTVTAAWA